MYCLLWSEWFSILNESLITEHKAIFKNSISFATLFHDCSVTIFIQTPLFLCADSAGRTRQGAEWDKTDEPWMLRSGCCSLVGHEPSSISITSFIWQTHQRQETTPLPVSIQPWPRVQGAGPHLQTNVPQDRAYLPCGSRGQRGLQPQTRDNTGQLMEP